jgi:hypothetical protein
MAADPQLWASPNLETEMAWWSWMLVGLWALVINGVIAPQPAVAAAPTEEGLQLSQAELRLGVWQGLKECLDGASIYLNLYGNERRSTSGSGSLSAGC